MDNYGDTRLRQGATKFVHVFGFSGLKQLGVKRSLLCSLLQLMLQSLVLQCWVLFY